MRIQFVLFIVCCSKEIRRLRSRAVILGLLAFYPTIYRQGGMLLIMVILVCTSADVGSYEFIFPALAMLNVVTVKMCEHFVYAASALFDVKVSVQRMQVIH